MAGDLANFARGDIANFLGGHRVPSANGKTYGVCDPVSNSVYARAAASGGADVNRAVNAAQAALAEGPWPALAAEDRAGVLRAIADGIERRAEDIAGKEAFDTGLPAAQARLLTAQAASCFRSCADAIEATARTDGPRPGPGPGESGYVLRAPGGIAGLITSWATPFLSASRKLAPALAAGCPVIMTTDEWTPLSATFWPEIIEEAGVPEGAFSLLHGRRGDDAVPTLTAHPRVPLISFTGEATAAQETIRAAAHLKRVSAEPIGASPCVIFADADLERAVDGAVSGAFGLNGLGADAGSRILVESSVYEEVVARLADRAARLALGPPSDPETEIGPLAHPDLVDRAMSYVRRGVRDEARLVAGGSRPAGLAEGNYLAPTVFADVSPEMRIFAEDIAGPIARVSSFSSEEDAVSLANRTPSARTVSVWTADPDRARRVAGAVEAGAAWVNSAAGQAPVPDDIDFFTRSRTVHTGAAPVSWFPCS